MGIEHLVDLVNLDKMVRSSIRFGLSTGSTCMVSDF